MAAFFQSLGNRKGEVKPKQGREKLVGKLAGRVVIEREVPERSFSGAAWGGKEEAQELGCLRERKNGSVRIAALCGNKCRGVLYRVGQDSGGVGLSSISWRRQRGNG